MFNIKTHTTPVATYSDTQVSDTQVLEHISACMDGEVTNTECQQLLEQRRHDTFSAHWQTWHLIGDTLRDTPATSSTLARRIAAQLEQELPIVAPKPARRTIVQHYLMPIAASLAAVTVVSLSTLYFSGIKQPTNPAQVASIAPVTKHSAPQIASIDEDRLNRFMAAHRDFTADGNSPLMDATYHLPQEPAQ